jgi:nucleotide-binding universal stress UspA family protein
MPPTVLVACESAGGDRSPTAFARALAPLLGARLSLVHVRDGEDHAPSPGPDLRVWRAASSAAGLQELIAAERPVLAVLGSAHDALHGRVRLGGTAERVITGATRAVAVVPRGYDAPALRSVAVGLLPTDESLRALRVGSALARAGGVPLLVLTVLRRSPDPADAAVLAARLAPAFATETHGPAVGIIRAAIDAAARAEDADPFDRGEDPSGTLEVRSVVVVGDAADALLRASARVGLLVLGSRAYGPPGVVLPGGAARKVLGGARCPVLLVPRAEVPAPVAVTAGR